MPTVHYCDVCDAEIESGYTVRWDDDIDDSRELVRAMTTSQYVVVCDSCWPESDDAPSIMGMLEVLFK